MEPSSNILISTGDAYKSVKLEQMLKNLTNSYKLYWLRAIFDEVLTGACELTFEHIAACMVAQAWYPVNYFRLSLGLQDQLASCIDYLRATTALTPDASRQEILATIEHSPDAQLHTRVLALTRYVPYRLIKPIYDDELALVRGAAVRWRDALVNPAIMRCNVAQPELAPYTISPDEMRLTINPAWAQYFKENQTIIRGWLDAKLIGYLQARNPSVPAIPLKIYPPHARNLSAATAYWQEALALCSGAGAPLHDIYSGRVFDAAGFEALGPLSIDHFVPWSFVLHDEAWNLTPMFRNENSAKGDKLPDLDTFMEPFSHQHFTALMATRESGHHRRYLESYLQVDANVLEYEPREECYQVFAANLERAIKPLHQIAVNQGFALWHPAA